MLELEATSTDDPAFINLASRLIEGAAVANGLTDIVAVHIDHWFGDRWLGFCGKLLGAAGVRSRLDGELPPPPFHPHRVLSVRAYRATIAQTFEYWDNVVSLHEYIPSQANIHRTLRQNRLYAWYSGDTYVTGKGVVMAYLIKTSGNGAWYSAFDKTPTWHLGRTVAVSHRMINEFMQRAGP